MEIIMVNHDFEELGIIDNASVIWASRYYKCGDFEVYVAATERNLNLINQSYFVKRREDEDNVGVIEDFNIKYTPEEGDMITLTGRFAPMILAKRVINQQTQLNGNVQNNIRNLINTNVINPVIPARKINYIGLGNLDNSITERMEMQTTGDNLLTKIEEICTALGLGFKMPMKNQKIYFEMYKGIDRSYGQSDNPWIIFSDEYDNLTDSEYSQVTSNYKNIAYVAGEGEGLNRRIIKIYNTENEPTGDNRFEEWVDQKNLSSNNNDLSEDELLGQMEAAGLEKLTAISRSFSGSVILRNYTYGKPENGGDIYLGDIVTIHNKRWNLYINVRIIEVIESEDQNGRVLTLTFGDISGYTAEPVITIIGPKTITLEVGSTYKDQGATAYDYYDGDLTDSMITVDFVNPSVVGKFDVVYYVTNSRGTVVTKTRNVNIVDTTKPVITLIGSSDITIKKGDKYEDKGAKAWDNYDGDLTEEIKVKKDVKTSQVGVYTVRYNVKDSSDNEATEVVRTVRVVE